MEYQEQYGSCLGHTWLTPGLWIGQIREPGGEISRGGGCYTIPAAGMIDGVQVHSLDQTTFLGRGTWCL